jgi:MFS family permease
LHPWQVVFVVVGLPGILVAALALTVREPPRLGTRTLGNRRGLPLREVFAYARRNGATIACHNLGFTLLAFASLAASAWVPTIFVRVHGWTAGEIGVRFGILVLIFGPVGSIVGGWLADFYQRRGRRTGKLFVGMVAAIGCIPFSIAFPLIDSATGSVALMMPFLFFVSFVWGLAPAALQEIMPNQMRGQATALYTGLVNLVGGGLGPYSVAVIADHVFHDPAKLNVAMSIVVPIALAGAAVLFWLGTKPYIATLDRLKSALLSAEA